MKKLRMKAQYAVELVGLASDSIWNVTIDGKTALVQIHPTYSIALVPTEGHTQPSYAEALFYADCLSYDHDTPAWVQPKRSDFYRQRYAFCLERGHKKYTYESYFQDMAAALEMARNIRFGPLSYVEFRWPGVAGEVVDLPYTEKYLVAENELHLYAAALRQLDPLSEYLCYYRVLESSHGHNAKAWVAENVYRLKGFNFGFLAYGVTLASPYDRYGNIFAVHRRRALARLGTLQRNFSSKEEIAHYLYKENRCGIAHGKDIKRHDFGSDFFSVAKDSYILKLLARITIDEKSGRFFFEKELHHRRHPHPAQCQAQ